MLETPELDNDQVYGHLADAWNAGRGSKRWKRSESALRKCFHRAWNCVATERRRANAQLTNCGVGSTSHKGPQPVSLFTGARKDRDGRSP
jgi:hypothetical protein